MESARGGRWEVRAYPLDDRAFLAEAQAAVAESWDGINRGRRLLQDVRAKLRKRYPSCEMSFQDELAQLSGETTVIYAFRDGRAA